MKVKNIKIYDNGGETFDRYTVVAGNNVFGLSEDPLSPQGFNQWVCLTKDLDKTGLGQEVNFENLAPRVKGAIKRRIYAY